jgi:hypothetical protein
MKLFALLIAIVLVAGCAPDVTPTVIPSPGCGVTLPASAAPAETPCGAPAARRAWTTPGLAR